MTVIRPNSITGITSITAQANEINVFRHNGVLAGLQLNGVNHHTSAGVSTFHTVNILGNLDVAGVLTYQDVTNVDSLGIGSFRAGVDVSGGEIVVGSNIKLGNAGVITATSFVGSGANLTGIALTSLNINGNTNNRIITATGNQYSAQGESRFTFDGNTAEIGDQSSNSSSTLIVSRGEIIGGGTGPVIQLKHGPSSGTQRTHQIYSHVGDLIVQADSNENLKIETGGRESIRITPNSDMGLSNTGTNNPNHYSGWCTFTINGTSGAELDFERGGSLQADILCGGNGLLYTNRLSGDYHAFQTHNGSSVGERLRIGSGGEVSLRRGGISATPSVEIYGSGNASDADADNLTIHNWGDSDGDYWRLGVNCGLNNSGNDSKPSNTLKGAGITIDGRYGRVFLKTSPSSSSTVHDALIVDSNGIVRTPLQPAFRSYTTSDGNSNGTVSGIWNTGADDKRKFDNNDDFNESNGRFTAPVDGVYQISVAWDELHPSNTIIDVQINGGSVNLYSTEQRSAGSSWNSWFTSSIAKMSSGDYVTINLRNTSGSYPFHQAGGRWGHFSVYLIG